MTGETEGEQDLTATPPRLTLADLRGLTPLDLRDLSDLRREHAALQQAAVERGRDQAHLEDENRYLRTQLAEALAGWRDAQRRTPGPQKPEATQAVQDVVEAAAPTPPGPWGRLWAWLAD